MSARPKNKTLAAWLAVVLGSMGAHRFYLRGLSCRSTLVPRGMAWARMSDHLPLVAELEPD